jgi:endonuclease/exonuclease/phosphatase family metal-dependent hydrolase
MSKKAMQFGWYPMWIRTLFALCVCFLPCCANSRNDLPQSLRLVSYNVRVDTPQDGVNDWRHRRDDVAALIGFYAPDIAGIQEVLPHQLADLKARLTEYEFVGIGRDGTSDEGEWAPLAFRADRFELVDYGVFWLSRTPEVSSIGWDAAFPRMATWAHLVDRRTKHRFLAINTHWDHVGITARLESGHMIRDWVVANKGPCEPVFLLGDMNAISEEESYLALVSPGDGALTDTVTVTQSPPFGPRGSFNGFDVGSAAEEAIDHILFAGNVSVIRHGIITQQWAGRLPSDHYPVLADVSVASC